MKVNNYFKMTILAHTKNESFVRNVVASFCTYFNPSVEEINDVKTAVSEAFTNCVVHAYPEEDGEVFIDVCITERKINIKIEDYGRGIQNITQAMQPFYTSKPENERSGMGFTLMQAFMNEVNVYSEVGRGTTVTLIKEFPENDA